MNTYEIVNAVIWLAMLLLAGLALYRVRTRRSHIGSAAAGSIYDMVQEEKRKAIETVVADKAAKRDFERGEDDDDPSNMKKGRDR